MNDRESSALRSMWLVIEWWMSPFVVKETLVLHHWKGKKKACDFLSSQWLAGILWLAHVPSIGGIEKEDKGDLQAEPLLAPSRHHRKKGKAELIFLFPFDNKLKSRLDGRVGVWPGRDSGIFEIGMEVGFRVPYPSMRCSHNVIIIIYQWYLYMKFTCIR